MTSDNPLATADQEQIEFEAAKLLDTTAVRRAKAELAEYWLGEVNPSPELRGRFNWELDQTIFCGAMNVLNADSKHPKIHTFGRFSHQVSGLTVPGTKHAHPNPDYVYRFIPVNGVSHYVIQGSIGNRRPAALEIALLDKHQAYLVNLSLSQMTIDSSGHFMITIDPEPANGRSNHIRAPESAFQILIRDVISDLDAQRPVSLAIERLGAVSTNAITVDEAAAACGPATKKLIDDLMYVNANFVMSKPVNTFFTPAVQTEKMYSVAQAYSPGHFRLDDDEALVFTLDLGGAAYATVPVSNMWGGIGDFLNHIGGLGTGRAEANPDGTYTIVVSPRDPGVYNWADTAGLHEGVVFVRWVGFDAKTAAHPLLTYALVKLDELKNILPPSMRYVDPVARREQLARHKAAYLGVMG